MSTNLGPNSSIFLPLKGCSGIILIWSFTSIISATLKLGFTPPEALDKIKFLIPKR